MELANVMVNGNVAGEPIRQATKADAGAIMRLLQTAVYRHLHVDWYVPGDWLGNPGFVLKMAQNEKQYRSQFQKFLGVREKVEACLAVAADPMPAAWVRVAALAEHENGKVILGQLVETAVSTLKQQNVSEIAWLTADDWPAQWLADFGFAQTNALETYIKEDQTNLEMPDVSGLDIRPVLEQDVDQLAQIEAKAFAPLWRHSARGLLAAKNQSFSFDVALLDGAIVGFQLSTPNDYGIHLVRMTVDPDVQGRGVGSALLVHAINGYYHRNRTRITLNTQTDNLSSQKLYAKFGFTSTGQQFPIWTRPLLHEGQ